MAEVQTNTETGESVQQFIEFVMMQAQNAALFLGHIPHPQKGTPEVNLDLAKLFIDQLVMIRQKTRGNLTNDELAVLNNAITNLQMGFVEASRQGGDTKASAPEVEAPEPPEAPSDAPATGEPAAPVSEEESKKKFTKSYGS